MIRTGGEFRDFVKRQNLDSASTEKLERITTKILERTELLGGAPNSNCQLVVGEVQSGKTMSFTALIALAHENGFPLVVVLAGTKDQLLIQTSDRLTKDLRADGNGGANPWVMFEKPKRREHSANLNKLQRALSIWREQDAPEVFKPTAVITVLKNRTSIDAAAALIESLRSKIDLNEYPVLIIDDEGDQAGLNLSWSTGEESTIYSAIGRLRRSLNRHSYVMYTATPQGPLLVNIEDTLSPKFVTLLESGPDYLGGNDLFNNYNEFTQVIPQDEAAQVFDISPVAPIPNSLKQAIAYYLIALYVAQKRSYPKPVSMLIHPSSQMLLHNKYESWVSSVLSSWETILREPEEYVYANEKKMFFESAVIELKKTCELGRDWDLDSALKEIRWWISKIEVRIVNSETNNINANEWLSKAGWILIGGNKLERGFTIENLAVTYMPRSTGVGNVDVIQQRGRFFGYKRKYKDLLRGWFFEDHIQAYISYVDHEDSIRSQLGKVDKKGQRLAEWRRRFLLDPAYRPVRSQVISLGISQRRLSTFKQHMLFDPRLLQFQDDFRERLDSYINDLQRMPQETRTDRGNYFVSLEFDDALELLTDWPMSPENRAELDDLIWAVQSLPDELTFQSANLVFMDWDVSSRTQNSRERSMLQHRADPARAPEEQVIANIFQGRSGRAGIGYPGDDQMYTQDAITIQVHLIKPVYERTEMPQVYALGLLFPDNASGFVVEDSVRTS
jgi:hypothetical protein